MYEIKSLDAVLVQEMGSGSCVLVGPPRSRPGEQEPGAADRRRIGDGGEQSDVSRDAPDRAGERGKHLCRRRARPSGGTASWVVSRAGSSFAGVGQR